MGAGQVLAKEVLDALSSSLGSFGPRQPAASMRSVGGRFTMGAALRIVHRNAIGSASPSMTPRDSPARKQAVRMILCAQT